MTSPPVGTVLLRVLGTPVLEAAGQVQPLAPARPVQMLAFLAQQADWVSRERIAALFWPDHSAEAARRNVRKLVFRAHALHLEPALEERAGSLRWPVPTDVQRFEEALAAGHAEAALQWWRGEPWQGIEGPSTAFDAWLHFERQHLRARWRNARLALIGAPAAQPAAVAVHARALLEHDPLDEAAIAALMQVPAAAVSEGGGWMAFQQYTELLAQTHGLTPAPRIQALAAGARSAGAHGAAVRTAQPATPGVGDEGFVGRRAELHELAQLLRQAECRWLTLTGPGGIGKSRLARVAAGALTQPGETFAAGLAWVAFDDVADISQARARLAAHFKLELDADVADPWQPVARALQRSLHTRTLLLVLDNLEHLPDLAQHIQAAVAPCPGVRVLATSRVRLGLPGEWLLPLAGLPWPAPEDSDRPEAFDAVRLFIQRASALDPAFDARPQYAAITALCQHVEGLPLALELAAAWTHHFSVADIVRDLRAGHADVLEPVEQARGACPPGAPPKRPQGVASTFEHSWRLLSPAERVVLARLSALTGAFTRAAARSVAQAPLALLSALIDKSLLRAEPVLATQRAAGESRLSLHPLIQQFAARRLAQDGAAQAAARESHARHFLQLLARYPRGRWSEQAAYFVEVEADLGNIRLAWAHAVQSGWRADLAAGAVALASYFHSRGRCDEGVSMLEAAAPLLHDDTFWRTELQCSLALLEFTRSQFSKAAALAREALRSTRRRRDPRLLRSSLFLLGNSLHRLGQHEGAYRCHVESLALARTEGNLNAIAGGLAMLAELALTAGRAREAAALAQESLDLQGRMGVAHADSAAALAYALHLDGDAEAAMRALALARDMLPTDRTGTERGVVELYDARIALDRGALDRAQACAQAALAAVAEGGQPADVSSAQLLLARVALARSDAAQARHLLRVCVRHARECRLRDTLASALVVWAEIQQSQAEPAAALRSLHAALAATGLDHATRSRALAVQGAARAALRAHLPASATPPESAPTLDAAIDDLLRGD